MHIRVSKKIEKGITYKYVQLVESYRNPEGMPTNRIVAHLGKMSDLELENLKNAFRASRAKKCLVLQNEVEEKDVEVQVIYDYLDIALMNEIWKISGIFRALKAIDEETNRLIPLEKVVRTLAIHRCINPGSKLQSERWIPTTSLPEIIGFDWRKMNYTRIGRALKYIAHQESELLEAISTNAARSKSKFSAIYMDVTDTYFEGRGPELAQISKTKMGISNKYAIGILLTCDKDGIPLNWKVLPGRKKDHLAMNDTVEEIKVMDWVQDTPIVFDRAMGNEKTIDLLTSSKMHFITAVNRREVDTYTHRIPYEPFKNLKLKLEKDFFDEDEAKVREIAETLNMEKVNERLFIIDKGILAKGSEIPIPNFDALDLDPKFPNAAVIKEAELIKKVIDDEKIGTISSLARVLGISDSKAYIFIKLASLPEKIKMIIKDGKAEQFTINELIDIANMKAPEEAVIAFENFKFSGKRRKCFNIFWYKKRDPRSVEEEPLRVILYFNPEMYVEQSMTVKNKMSEFFAYIKKKNLGLTSPKVRQSKDSIKNEIESHLRKLELLKTISFTLTEISNSKSKRPTIRIACKVDQKSLEWKNRMNGFMMIIASKKLDLTARKIVELYKSKDAIEKDFQSIKSFIKVRPIFHYSDPSVRAHVSICMLSLYMERFLSIILKKKNLNISSKACLEILQTCRLAKVKIGSAATAIYKMALLTSEQKEILGHLGLEKLANIDYLMSRIQPRI